jgi:hypothetical protein
MLPTTRHSLRRDLALALDPARLFQRAIGAAPDPWQARLLRSPQRQLLLNCSRQAGKSTTTAALALHGALYDPRALVLILGPALRQAQELFRKLKSGYAAIGGPAAYPIETETALTLELAHGARVVCLPGKEATIRGFSAATLLIVDEASRVDDALYAAVRPMLATTGGRIVLLSTPAGQRGFFWREWTEGGTAWERVEVPATAVPRIPASFLEEERRALGPLYAQEYGCQFLDSENQVFSSQHIHAAVRPDLAPLPDDDVLPMRKV